MRTRCSPISLGEKCPTKTCLLFHQCFTFIDHKFWEKNTVIMVAPQIMDIMCGQNKQIKAIRSERHSRKHYYNDWIQHNVHLCSTHHSIDLTFFSHCKVSTNENLTFHACFKIKATRKERQYTLLAETHPCTKCCENVWMTWFCCSAHGFNSIRLIYQGGSVEFAFGSKHHQAEW